MVGLFSADVGYPGVFFFVPAVFAANPISNTPRAAGRRADSEISTENMSIFCASPSDVARNCPSHASLQLVKSVEIACVSRNSQRETT